MMDAHAASPMSDPRRAHISAVASAAGRVVEELDTFCRVEGLPAEAVWPLRIALDEIVTNIVTHGGGGRTIDVSFRRDAAAIEVVIADDGPPFDPLASPDPDVTLPLEARQPGGLGILFVRSLMDEVRYERKTGNVLTLRKRLGPDGPGPREPR
jgi:serine/threonine-protein kinase RsbW